MKLVLLILFSFFISLLLACWHTHSHTHTEYQSSWWASKEAKKQKWNRKATLKLALGSGFNLSKWHTHTATELTLNFLLLFGGNKVAWSKFCVFSFSHQFACSPMQIELRLLACSPKPHISTLMKIDILAGMKQPADTHTHKQKVRRQWMFAAAAGTKTQTAAAAAN